MSCACPPKNKITRTQFAEPGGAFARSLVTTTCLSCDAPGPVGTHTPRALGFNKP